jgi:hypothetical protein
VSPLWRDELGIYLGPQKLTLTRLARGVRARPAGETSWSGAGGPDGAASAPLDALDVLLARREWRGAVARVVLADHWVRYAICPYAAQLGSTAERTAHARHVLAGIYGEVVGEWTITLADAPPGVARVACAVPSRLLQELGRVLERHATPLVSLQPQLVAAYNHWRPQLPAGGAWFVTVEPGSLAAARLSPGGWDRVHGVRIGADWAVELRRLRTFGRLAANSGDEGRVYVDAPAQLRNAAGAASAELTWLEEAEPGNSTAGRIEYFRRHSA